MWHLMSDKELLSMILGILYKINILYTYYMGVFGDTGAFLCMLNIYCVVIAVAGNIGYKNSDNKVEISYRT